MTETQQTPQEVPQTTETKPEATTQTTQETTQTSSTEKKTEGKQSLLNEAEKDDKAEDKAAAGAPEKYEPFKVPDGFTLDEAVATEAGTLFKELGLTQAAGQKLVDFYTAKTQEAFDAPINHWLDQQEAWQKEIKEDKDIGGKLPEVKSTIRKFVDSVGDQAMADAFREAMDYTGAGNNPAFIKLFYKLASKFTEGTHVGGDKPTSESQKSPTAPGGPGAQAMYPNLKPA